MEEPVRLDFSHFLMTFSLALKGNLGPMKEALLRDTRKSGFSTLCDPEQVTKPLFGPQIMGFLKRMIKALELLFNHFKPQIPPFVLPFVSFF